MKRSWTVAAVGVGTVAAAAISDAVYLYRLAAITQGVRKLPPCDTTPAAEAGEQEQGDRPGRGL